MKKFWVLFLSFICFSCDTGKQESPYVEAHGKVKVLSTIAMIDDLVGAIGGDEIDHYSLIQGNIDPHNYELVKGDGEKLMQADVLFFNGLGLEQGASLKHHFKIHPHAVALGEWVYEKKKNAFVFVDGQVDPHIWMDITLFAMAIEPIVQSLERADPSHASLFRERGALLEKHMIAKDHDLLHQMQNLASTQRFVVTSHDGYRYFIKRYVADPGEDDWEKRFIAPQGLAPDGQVGILDIKEVIDFLYKNNIHVVFPEANVSRDVLKKIVSICLEKGWQVTIADSPFFGDTMGDGEIRAGSYLDMIEHNVETFIHNMNTHHHGY